MKERKAVGIEYKPDVDIVSAIMRDPAPGGGYLVSAMVGDTKITYGAIVPRKQPSSQEYLLNYRDFNSQNSGIKKQIKLSRKLYYWGGIVGTAIDTLVEFAVTPIRIQGVEDEQQKKVLEYFKNYVNVENPNVTRGLNALVNEIVLEWFIAGNVFPYHNWRDVTIEGSKKPYELPNTIPLLNPDNIDLDETAASVGVQIIKMKIPETIQAIVRKKQNHGRLTEEEKIIYENTSEDIRRLVKKNKEEVILSPEKVSHIKRKGRSYNVWGIPYLTRSFGEVANKQKIKALDTATIDGMINRITIFKVGDKDNPTTWAPERLGALHSLLSSPNPSNMLVWGYDLSVEDIGPDGKILEFKNRYDQADYDILAALGIPINLFIGTGKEKLGADPWITLMAMVEKLEKLREQIQVYLEDLLKEICVRNGFKGTEPKIRWQRMNLRNIKELRTLVLALYDRGLLPIRTALEESNYEFDEMLRQRQIERKDGIEEDFELRPLPYQGPAMDQKPADKQKDSGRPEKDDEKTKDGPEVKDKKEDQRVKKSADYGSVMQDHYTHMYDRMGKRAVIAVEQNDDIEYRITADVARIADHARRLVHTLATEGKTVTTKTARFLSFFGGELDRLSSDIVDDINVSDKTEGTIEDIFEDYRIEFYKILGTLLLFTNSNDIVNSIIDDEDITNEQ